MKPDAHDHRARAAVDEPLARARQPALQARPGTFARLRDARSRRATAPRRPLHPLERAQPRRRGCSPQATAAARRCTPVAPHLYRGLVRAAYPAIHAADPGAQVLIGALSRAGSDLRARNSTLRPLAFLRALGCVDAQLPKLRTGRCKGFKPATGGRLRLPPARRADLAGRAIRNRDDVDLASLPRLESALDRLQRGGRLQRDHAPLQPLPRRVRLPDEPARPPPASRSRTQDRWLQRAAYRAWRDPRVQLLTQYLWYDEPRGARQRVRRLAVGPAFLSGRAKPALAHFDTPMQVDARAQPAVGPGAARRTRRR